MLTVFALTYAVGAPFLGVASARVPGRPLILGPCSWLVLANIACAGATSLGWLLISRVVAAIAAALLTPTASAAVVALAGPAGRGTALSIVLGGLAMGTVLGVPLGTALGQHVGWQASLLFVAAVALVAVVGIALTLADLPVPAPVSLRRRFTLIAGGRVLTTLGVNCFATAAGIMIYTYIARVLFESARISGGELALTLLVYGIGGSVGAFASGWVADRIGSSRTLTVAIACELLAAAGFAYASALVTVLPVALVAGAAGWSLSAASNHRLTGLVTDLPNVISFNSSGVYLGQSIGAVVGGLLLAAHVAARDLCLVSAALTASTLFGHLFGHKVARARDSASLAPA